MNAKDQRLNEVSNVKISLLTVMITTKSISTSVVKLIQCHCYARNLFKTLSETPIDVTKKNHLDFSADIQNRN